MANQAVDHSKVTGSKKVDGPLSPAETQADSRPREEEDGRAKNLAEAGEGQADPSPH